MIGQDDLTLVKQSLSGDNKAFESIVDKYQKTIFNVALKVTDDHDDAEDITQSVFIKAYEKLDSFDPKYRFFSWLYRIVINESLNFVNQRNRFEGLDESAASTEKSPEESYDETQTTKAVQDALMNLSLEQRVVIVLKHFQDLPYRDIGYILDLPERTVKSRLFSARQALREILTRKAL